MSYRTLKIITVLIPTILIGGFEFLRHSFLLHNLSMDAGNYFITILTLVVSYVFSTWMFKTIKEKNQRIAVERELRAIYEERERLAKELHDSIAQTLFLLNVNLKKGRVSEAQGQVNAIDTHVRQAIYNLRMSPQDAVSFVKRMENWLSDWSAVSGIDTKVELLVVDGTFSSAEEIHLMGIIQEAFTNIRKHSQASAASIVMNTTHEGWELDIRDNGVGLDGNVNHSGQYGLTMLRERVAKLNASIHIESGENGGTIIKVVRKRAR